MLDTLLLSMDPSVEEMFTTHLGTGFGKVRDIRTGPMPFDDPTRGVPLTDRGGRYADATMTGSILDIRAV